MLINWLQIRLWPSQHVLTSTWEPSDANGTDLNVNQVQWRYFPRGRQLFFIQVVDMILHFTGSTPKKFMMLLYNPWHSWHQYLFSNTKSIGSLTNGSVARHGEKPSFCTAGASFLSRLERQVPFRTWASVSLIACQFWPSDSAPCYVICWFDVGLFSYISVWYCV